MNALVPTFKCTCRFVFQVDGDETAVDGLCLVHYTEKGAEWLTPSIAHYQSSVSIPLP